MKVLDHKSIYLMAKRNGIDFLFYDMEHGHIPEGVLYDLCLFGTQIELDTWIRVPQLDKDNISRTLDMGAKGIMVPMIESKEMAQELVKYSKYAPIGNRGYSSGAHTNYVTGGSHKQNMEAKNKEVITIAQIETKKGVECAEDIISVEGIDGIIIGPVDLSISMGHVDDLNNPENIAAIQSVIDLCKEYNKPVGIISNYKFISQFVDDIDWVIGANDLGMLNGAFANVRKEYEDILNG